MIRWLAWLAAAVVALALARESDPVARPEDRTLAHWRTLERQLEARPGQLLLLFGDRRTPAIAEVLDAREAERRAHTPAPFESKDQNNRPRTWELCDLTCVRDMVKDSEAATGSPLETASLVGWLAAAALALALAWRAAPGLAPGLTAAGPALLLVAAVILNLRAPPSAPRVLGTAVALAAALIGARLLRARPAAPAAAAGDEGSGR